MLGLISYISILLTLSIGTWLRPSIGIAAVLCLYGLKQWGQTSTLFFATHREFTNYAIFIVCIVGVLRAAADRSCFFCRMPAVAALVYALYAYAFFTILWAPDQGSSLHEWVVTAPYVLTVTVLAPLLINDLDDARTAVLWTAFIGSIICTLALGLGHWGDRGLVVFGHQAMEDSNNIYLYETNPLALSSLAGSVFLISVLSLGRPNRAYLRLFALASIPIALGVMLRSGTRGQIIAAGLSLLLAFPIAFRPKEGLPIGTLVMTAAAVLGLGWWGATFVNIDTSRWTASHTSEAVEGRFEMAQRLLKASMSDFFTAIFGLGNSSSFKVLGIYPHIAGLEILAEEGIFGAALYLAIIVLVVRSVARIGRTAQLNDSRRNALAIVTALFIFELIVSSKQGTLLFSIYVFAYAIIIARLDSPGASPVAAPSGNPGLLMTRPFENLLR